MQSIISTAARSHNASFIVHFTGHLKRLKDLLTAFVPTTHNIIPALKSNNSKESHSNVSMKTTEMVGSQLKASKHWHTNEYIKKSFLRWNYWIK